MKRIFWIGLVLLVFPGVAYSAGERLHYEAVYQETWCKGVGGQIEVRLPEGTRIDCLTAVYAVEVDFSDKWYQGIGQALYYAMKADKRPGLVLIKERESDQKYIDRARDLIAFYRLGIRLWVMSPGDL